MAELNGVNAAKIAKNPPEKVEWRDEGGKVRCHYDEHTFASEPANGDVINIGGKIPKGARIVGAKLYSEASGGTTGDNLDLGHAGHGDQAADPDSFIAALAILNEAKTTMDDEVAAAGDGLVTEGELQPQVRYNDVDGSMNGKKVKAWIYYVQSN